MSCLTKKVLDTTRIYDNIGQMKETKTQDYCSAQFYAISGAEVWYNKNHLYHRVDGPAYINKKDKYVEWWYDGTPMLFDAWCEITGKTEDEKLYLKLQYGDCKFK